MLDDHTRQYIVDEAARMYGDTYKFGSKWKNDDPSPQTGIDCSGLVSWAYSRSGFSLPDGSSAQRTGARKLTPTESPKVADLAFFEKDGVVHHVGMLYDRNFVIEARGEPYNQVILRPRIKWEEFNEFTGWYTYGS